MGVTIVELSDQGQALLPRLKAAWQQLAEHTVAGLTSTPLDQLADALADVAASLTTFQHATSEPAPPPRDIVSPTVRIRVRATSSER